MATIESVKKLVAEQRKAQEDAPNPNAERFAEIDEAHTEAVRSGNAPGERMAIMVIAMAAADGDAERAIRIINDDYKRSDMIPQIERTMSAQNPESGGYLAPERWHDEIIPYVHDTALLPSLGVRILDNPTGNISMARVSAAANVHWKAPEGGRIKQTKTKFGRLNLRDKTCAGLVSVTNKLMRIGGPSFVNFIDNDLRVAVGTGIDKGAWFGDGSEDEPAGLFSKIIDVAGVNKVDLSTTFDPDSLVDMIVAHFKAKGTAVNLRWAASVGVWGALMKMRYATGGPHIFQEELSRGTLMGIPFHWGTALEVDGDTSGKLGLADWNEYILAPSRPVEIAKSAEAAYYDEDGSITAAFPNDETIIRVIFGGDMGPRRLQSFTLAKSVKLN